MFADIVVFYVQKFFCKYSPSGNGFQPGGIVFDSDKRKNINPYALMKRFVQTTCFDCGCTVFSYFGIPVACQIRVKALQEIILIPLFFEIFLNFL